MWNACYLERAVAERINQCLQIADRERLTKMAEDGNRRGKFQGFHYWIADVGRVLAARHGAEPSTVKGRA